MLTLAHPWLLVLLPLPWLLRLVLPAHHERLPGVRVPFLRLLAELSGRAPTPGAVVLSGTWLRAAAGALCWIAVVAALARPQWLEPPVTRTVPVRDLLLAVDLSGSMETQDFTDAAGRKVDRLTAVKEVLDGFLAKRAGDRVGLILFGSAAFVQAPFTEDLAVCRELLAEAQVRMAGPKTAIGDAIGLAITTCATSTMPEKTLIVLTDGNDTGSRVPPDQAAAIAHDRGITIHTVAVGDPTAVGEAKLDTAVLQRVATATGGQYAFAADRAALERVYDRLDALQTRQATAVSHQPRRELFAWPLAAALIASALPHLHLLLPRRRRTEAPA